MCDAFVEHVEKPLVDQLKSRICVRSGRRRLFEFHETAPKWFRQAPKLLLPEIVTTAVRIELDSHGKKLPLHSVIAVKVPSIAAGRRLRRYLKCDKQQRSLISRAPRLSGGSVRLQVSAIRRVLLEWLRKQGQAKTHSRGR